MDIIDTYQELRRQGEVLDQYHFDRRWLGKTQGYFAYLRSTGSQPSIETLMRFYLRLLSADSAYAVYGLDGELRHLAQSVMGEIKRRCS